MACSLSFYAKILLSWLRFTFRFLRACKRYKTNLYSLHGNTLRSEVKVSNFISSSLTAKRPTLVSLCLSTKSSAIRECSSSLLRCFVSLHSACLLSIYFCKNDSLSTSVFPAQRIHSGKWSNSFFISLTKRNFCRSNFSLVCCANADYYCCC